MRLACVIHRYGADIAGGSEAHCRLIAERLAARHDVTILTTCAHDYVSWQNVYPAGESHVNGVRVLRFPVARQRSMHRFAEASELAFSGKATDAEQEQWFRENGPESPDLLRHLDMYGAGYDRVLFWAFRYAGSFFGLPLVANRAVLVPTAEEDPVIKLDVLGPYFSKPLGYLFLTPEEQQLVARRACGPLPPSEVVGLGLEPARPSSPREASEKIAARGIVEPFLLYLGRVDPNKGCVTLLDHFTRYAAERESSVPLVLAGPVNMPIPEHPFIKSLGFVDEATRDALLDRGAVLLMPSPYESLSIVLLEAWNHARAVLVNARCSVIKGQTRRANGGLYYQDYDEFACALDRLLGNPDLAAQLGAQGLAYVEREYRWPTVMGKVERLLATVGPAASA